MTRLTLVAIAIAFALFTASAAVAGDAQIFSSASCTETGSSVKYLTRDAGGLTNNSSFQWPLVICPVIKQHASRGVLYAHAHVTGKSVACFVARLAPVSALLKVVSSTGTGAQTIGLPGMTRATNDDAYVLGCYLPPGTSFHSYRFSE